MPLQDSDNFIIGRGTDPYKITYQDLKDDLNYVPPPVGTINQPTVLEPNEGAGGGGARYLKSDAITEVEGGGTHTCSTETISNVESESITYPNASHFVLQIPANADWLDDNDNLSCTVTNANGITWRLDDPNETSRGDLKSASTIGRFGDLKGHNLIISRTGNFTLSVTGFYKERDVDGNFVDALVDVTKGGTVNFLSLVLPPTEGLDGTAMEDVFDGSQFTGAALILLPAQQFY